MSTLFATRIQNTSKGTAIMASVRQLCELNADKHAGKDRKYSAPRIRDKTGGYERFILHGWSLFVFILLKYARGEARFMCDGRR